MVNQTEDKIKAIKKKYPQGTKVKLLHMEDKRPVPAGTIGTVRYVDDAGTLHVAWENGSGLGLIPDVDEFEVLS